LFGKGRKKEGRRETSSSETEQEEDFVRLCKGVGDYRKYIK